MQVPGNFDAPSHALMREAAATHPRPEELRPALTRLAVAEPDGYLDVLAAAGLDAQAWETTYLHVLDPEGAQENPVLEWVRGTGLDVWVVQREEQDVTQYAETWVRDGGHRPGTPAFEELYAAWLADFAARGVERVGFGVVTLQRPATEREPWLDLVDVRTPVAAPMGPTVLRGLEARTWLAEHTDEELLDVPWQVADDVTEERVGRPGATDPQVIQLRQGGGLRRVVRLDTLAAGFVGACDGELTARQLCAGLAVLTGAAVEEVQAGVLTVLRDLVRDGLLR